MFVLGQGKSDLTPMQSIFLMILYGEKKALSGAEFVEHIKDQIGLESVPTPGAIYKILHKLESLEYVLKDSKEDKDKRIKRYQLSEKGEKKTRDLMIQATKMYTFMSNCCIEICIPCSFCQK